MDERFARVGEIELCYETFGDPADPAMLLVMGLGTQMIGWHEDFCTMLAGRGFHVIRYDNRDIGRSTHVRARPPTPRQVVTRDRRAAAYTLEDLATDAAGLLGELGRETAHVVGVSMGGMIAQTLAAARPDRVLSLASIMSNTGARWRGQPALRVMPFFLRSRPATREESVDRTLALFRMVGSPAFDRDEAHLRAMSELAFERGPGDAAGTGRQLAAIFASGDRTPSLSRITASTIVIHGTRDRLVMPSGGRATAAAIPGARLEMIEGMGHDLPRGVWPRVVDLVVDNARQAQAADAARAA
jgi:pimeloyl-ACP methyl ester carboxylesterase